MAKKSNRVLLGFQCTDCNHQNYVTQKNNVNSPEKLAMSKFCKICKKITTHKEKAKLK